MTVRPKFNPETAKVAFRPFIFNGIKYQIGDDFVAKKAKASPRQMKAMYNARRIADKCEELIKPIVKPIVLTEAEEYAKAQAEKEAEDRAIALNKAGVLKGGLLQVLANKEADEAVVTQAKSDKAKAKAKANARYKANAKAKAKAKKEKAGPKPWETDK